MSIAFPQLQHSQEWKARLATVRDELRPTERELGEILRDAARHAAQFKAELEAFLRFDAAIVTTYETRAMCGRFVISSAAKSVAE